MPTLIYIELTDLTTVVDFKYRGSSISNGGTLDKEICGRISKESQDLGRLGIRVLTKHNFRQSTKLKVYKATVFTSLVYGSEAWTLSIGHVTQNSFICNA
ncbi:hypothetical protein ElyMa_005544100 [Elysia marginata]|uniref:Uncharacterized protein n=1 Tax=Elysia marginata TaxID=1093978 RepID=A0AAV4EXS7_9GAST|nr:hypothetical protein ElyMa_005544100 [Elysia marginata]